MKSATRTAVGFVAVASAISAAACAASDAPTNDASTNLDGGDAAETPLLEAGAGDAAHDGQLEATACSPAGWCPTRLPDSDLQLRGVWPLEGRAFAIAESRTVGVKVLEWEDDTARWIYIDDNTQNDFGFGAYAGTIWSPSENEVYYGVATGYVYHGTRASTTSPWSWVRFPLEDQSHDTNPPNYNVIDDRDPQDLVSSDYFAALGVWGTSADDVYAWSANTIFHRKVEDGGNEEWIPEYVADDIDNIDTERMFFARMGGSNSGDIWFAGGRAELYRSCPLVVRKTPAGYQRVADGALPQDDPNAECGERAGYLNIGGGGWFLDVQSPAPGKFIGLKNGHDVVQIWVATDGGLSTATSTVSVTATPLVSLWSSSVDQLWLSGVGSVLRCTNVWVDGGTYQISTIALNGAPLRNDIYQVRGVSNTNLWAVGDRYALRKTTP